MSRMIELIRPTWIPDHIGDYVPFVDERYDGKAVELIRCRDCHWWNVIVRQDDTTPPKGYCGCHRGVHFGDWYCADGKRRIDDA